MGTSNLTGTAGMNLKPNNMTPSTGYTTSSPTALFSISNRLHKPFTYIILEFSSLLSPNKAASNMAICQSNNYQVGAIVSSLSTNSSTGLVMIPIQTILLAGHPFPGVGYRHETVAGFYAVMLMEKKKEGAIYQ